MKLNEPWTHTNKKLNNLKSLKWQLNEVKKAEKVFALINSHNSRKLELAVSPLEK